MDNQLNHTRIIIDSFEKKTLINYEVGNKLYPITTLHKTGEHIGEVIVDNRTDSSIVYNIGNLLQLFGECIKVALNQRDLMQNKPQQD